MELGCGYFVEMEWPYLTVFFLLKKAKKIRGIGHTIFIMPPFRISFFVLRLVILPQPGLGRIAEQVKY